RRHPAVERTTVHRRPARGRPGSRCTGTVVVRERTRARPRAPLRSTGPAMTAEPNRGAQTNAPSVLFLCVHNAGRSQMALGWFEHLARGRALAWSGGSTPAAEVN